MHSIEIRHNASHALSAMPRVNAFI
jgi:hypothetical protein